MTEHIAKQFDVELNELQTNMLEMGADVRGSWTRWAACC